MNITIICPTCGREMQCAEAGVLVKELFRGNTEVYKVWSADLMACPECGLQVVTRFADKPMANHFDPIDKMPMAEALALCAKKIKGKTLFEWKEYVSKKQ